MKISVIVPTLDEAARIDTALESVGAHGTRAQRADFDVLVVDGGSRDDTLARAHALGVATLNSAPGRARQLEAGVQATRGDVLLFLHADTRLPREWSAAVRRALADPAVSGGAFRLRFDEPSMGLRVVEWVARLRVLLFRLPYGDQAIFVRRAVLDAAGGVPQAPLMEDLDLVRAIRRQGRLALLPEAATTSARRYQQAGVLRTSLRHFAALLAWRLGLDRARVAAWYRG